MQAEIYMHGQLLGTHSFLLKDGFLKPDEYSELKAKYFLPGGETGTAAIVLESLGASVKIDGNLKSSIGQGLLVLLGVGEDDGQEDIAWLVRKISAMRIFDDTDGFHEDDIDTEKERNVEI